MENSDFNKKIIAESQSKFLNVRLMFKLLRFFVKWLKYNIDCEAVEKVALGNVQ